MITVDKIRKDFPALSTMTYLNTAAESIPPAVVSEAVNQYLADKQRGMAGREAHFEQEHQTKEAAAELLGFKSHEIGFCSCSAEAYNLLASALSLNSSDEVVISDLDFPSGATPWLVSLEKPKVHLWKSQHGALDIQTLIPLLSLQTRLVQISLVSFYNGWRIDWKPFVHAVRTHAPQALISVDLTQALGRCVLDLEGADIVISSTHKWLLGLHGGCVVGIPEHAAERITTRAGGWYHLANAFDTDRFERAIPQKGAAGFSVGMPSFAPIYALGASIRYLLEIGIPCIAQHADPLTEQVHQILHQLNLTPLAPDTPGNRSGIIAFKHPQSDRLQEALIEEDIHIMHQAGRMRVSIHGYNTQEDIDRFSQVLEKVL